MIRREKLPSKSVEEKEVNIWLKIEDMTSFLIIVCFNPLSPKSDWHLISPCNISPESHV